VTTRTIGKACAGKPHARTERGTRNRTRPERAPRLSLPMSWRRRVPVVAAIALASLFATYVLVHVVRKAGWDVASPVVVSCIVLSRCKGLVDDGLGVGDGVFRTSGLIAEGPVVLHGAEVGGQQVRHRGLLRKGFYTDRLQVDYRILWLQRLPTDFLEATRSATRRRSTAKRGSGSIRVTGRPTSSRPHSNSSATESTVPARR